MIMKLVDEGKIQSILDGFLSNYELDLTYILITYFILFLISYLDYYTIIHTLNLNKYFLSK